MREDGASEEDIAAALSRIAPPRAVYARVRDRTEGRRRRIETDSGAEPVTAEGMVRLARILPGGANRGGRTPELEDRLRDYAAAIAALSGERRYRPAQITALLVLERLHRTGGESQLRKDMQAPGVGGWQSFRADVLAGRFSGR